VPRFLKFFLPALLLPYVANATGWIMAEVGRVPWVVFGVMKIEDAVSPTVTVPMLWTSLIGYALVYTALIVAEIYLMVKAARGPASQARSEPLPAAVPALVGTD
jgi:cytochrome d ubiquinol oxidase subunit I